MEFAEYGLKMLKMDCLSFIHASTMRSLSFSDRKRSHRLEKYCDNKSNHHGGLIWRWSSLPPEKTDLLQVLGLIETVLACTTYSSSPSSSQSESFTKTRIPGLTCKNIKTTFEHYLRFGEKRIFKFHNFGLTVLSFINNSGLSWSILSLT